MPKRIPRGMKGREPTIQSQGTGGFAWEDTNFTYPTGFATVTKQMKLTKDYPEGTTETWRLELNRAPKGKIFIKDSRGAVQSIDEEAKPILSAPTFTEYYGIRQTFRSRSVKGDPLGGFQSGMDVEVVDRQRVEKWLESKAHDGFHQVPWRELAR